MQLEPFPVCNDKTAVAFACRQKYVTMKQMRSSCSQRCWPSQANWRPCRTAWRCCCYLLAALHNFSVFAFCKQRIHAQGLQHELNATKQDVQAIQVIGLDAPILDVPSTGKDQMRCWHRQESCRRSTHAQLQCIQAASWNARWLSLTLQSLSRAPLRFQSCKNCSRQWESSQQQHMQLPLAGWTACRASQWNLFAHLPR